MNVIHSESMIEIERGSRKRKNVQFYIVYCKKNVSKWIICLRQKMRNVSTMTTVYSWMPNIEYIRIWALPLKIFVNILSFHSFYSSHYYTIRGTYALLHHKALNNNETQTTTTQMLWWCWLLTAEDLIPISHCLWVLCSNKKKKTDEIKKKERNFKYYAAIY